MDVTNKNFVLPYTKNAEEDAFPYILQSGDIILAMCDVNQAGKQLSSYLPGDFVIGMQDVMSFEDFTRIEDLSLKHVYDTHRAITGLVRSNQGKKVIVCAGNHKSDAMPALALVSSYMIVERPSMADNRADDFSPFVNAFANNQQEIDDVFDFMGAVSSAVERGWLADVSFKDDSEQIRDSSFNSCINMAEYIHYDDGINGAFHLVDPNRLLLFRAPTDLPDQRTWMDLDDGRRLFSAAHYVDIFDDFDVRLVVRCGEASYDDSPLRAAGIEVEELPAGPTSLLAAVDRFLTLCSAAPGCIAVECSGGDDDGGCMAAVEVLVAARLIKRHGFLAPEAVAWIRMAHPPAPLPAPRLQVYCGETATGRR